MADTSNNSSGATPWLAFLLGAVIIVVAVIGFFVLTGHHIGSNTPSVNVTVPTPAAPTSGH
ncbi:MAG TPA: hypothetical protein VII56_01915 [Rhizomicrobium sp.]